MAVKGANDDRTLGGCVLKLGRLAVLDTTESPTMTIAEKWGETQVEGFIHMAIHVYY